MSNELENELAVLGQQGAALDAELIAEATPAVPGVADPVPMMDEETELRGMIELVGAIIKPAYPLTGAALTAQATPMAASAIPVLQKYGWSVASIAGKWGPEIGMAVVWLPAGMAIAGSIKQDKANHAAAEAEAKRKAEQSAEAGQPA